MAVGFFEELNTLFSNGQAYLIPWLEALGILWCINIFNWVSGSPLNILGIYPRHIFGLVGILFSPILHRNFSHLLLNSIPLFCLGLALLATSGALTFLWITLVVMVIGGLGVWLFARKGMHIGASSLVSGYFGYILVSAYKQPGVITIVLAVFVAYYFGGIFFGIFPKEKHVSWEGHFFGFVSGILCAYLPNLLTYFSHLFQ
jgi:membrane associated rhomboid family serine protease